MWSICNLLKKCYLKIKCSCHSKCCEVKIDTDIETNEKNS